MPSLPQHRDTGNDASEERYSLGRLELHDRLGPRCAALQDLVSHDLIDEKGETFAGNAYLLQAMRRDGWTDLELHHVEFDLSKLRRLGLQRPWWWSPEQEALGTGDLEPVRVYDVEARRWRRQGRPGDGLYVRKFPLPDHRYGYLVTSETLVKVRALPGWTGWGGRRKGAGRPRLACDQCHHLGDTRQVTIGGQVRRLCPSCRPAPRRAARQAKWAAAVAAWWARFEAERGAARAETASRLPRPAEFKSRQSKALKEAHETKLSPSEIALCAASPRSEASSKEREEEDSTHADVEVSDLASKAEGVPASETSVARDAPERGDDLDRLLLSGIERGESLAPLYESADGYDFARAMQELREEQYVTPRGDALTLDGSLYLEELELRYWERRSKKEDAP